MIERIKLQRETVHEHWEITKNNKRLKQPHTSAKSKPTERETQQQNNGEA